uniref:pro-glucagon-like n=1 Tax=Myxine glutinosa TaxID=7769 RepID=UPI00358E7568
MSSAFKPVVLLLPLLVAFTSSAFIFPDIGRGSSRFGHSKRYSEGSLTSDYTKILEAKKAQQFVRWLLDNELPTEESPDLGNIRDARSGQAAYWWHIQQRPMADAGQQVHA